MSMDVRLLILETLVRILSFLASGTRNLSPHFLTRDGLGYLRYYAQSHLRFLTALVILVVTLLLVLLILLLELLAELPEYLSEIPASNVFGQLWQSVFRANLLIGAIALPDGSFFVQAFFFPLILLNLSFFMSTYSILCVVLAVELIFLLI